MQNDLYVWGTTVCSSHPQSGGNHTFHKSDEPQPQEWVGENGQGLIYPIRVCIHCEQPCISGAPQVASLEVLSPGMRRLARAKSGQLAV